MSRPGADPTCCPVAGCKNHVMSSSLLMCRDCWRKVPISIRRAVNDAWDRYQAGSGTLDQLRRAQNLAIGSVRLVGAKP